MLIYWLLPLLVVITYVNCDTCDNLGTYLTKLNQLLPDDEGVSRTVDSHPSESRPDSGLAICSTGDSCCTPHSEQVLRDASTEIFHTYSISMAMQRVEDELRELRDQVLGEVVTVAIGADGVVAGEAARQYVVEQDIEVDTVARHRLVHLINSVYGTTWSSYCLDPLQGTRTLMSERVFAILNQYKKLISGLLEGINKIPALKLIAISELSDSCTAALTKSSLFEGLGCKKCGDATAAVKTCFNTCINVARGCMRPLLCHTQDWAAWVTRQDVLITELNGLASKRGAFLEALIERFELEYSTAVRDTEWNVAACNIQLNNMNNAILNQFKAKDVRMPSLTADIHRRQFGNSLLALPDSVCDKSSFVSDIQFEVDAACWNGAAVSPYIHPTPLFSLEEQKCNPEVISVQLQCDHAMDMMCSAYNVFSTEPAPGPTEKAVVNPEPSAAPEVKLATLLLATLLLVWGF